MAGGTGFDPGRVSIRVDRGGDGSAHAEVRCVRPSVVRVMRGQPAAKAVALVPLLFSLCGRAQGIAAQLALRAAQGDAVAAQRHEAVAREIAGEHLWRLLLDWPRTLGLPLQEALFVEARRQLADETYPAWAVQHLSPVFGRLLAALEEAPEPVGDEAPLLPALSALETVECWPRLDEAFASAPTWHGAPAETGALARLPGLRRGRPILDRVEARMREALSLAPGRASAAPVAPGIGRSAVETARGMLMHEMVLDGDQVADYVIVAPTEWNFHPRGFLPRWLTAAPAAEAESLSARVVLALDPCVPWRCEISSGPAGAGAATTGGWPAR